MHPLGTGVAGSSAQQLLWRRAAGWTALLCLLGGMVLLASSVRLPLLVLEPGPAPDVAKRTKIDAPTFASEGSIHLTTAQVDDPKGATGKEVLAAIFDADQTVFPKEAIYPSDRSDEHTESVQAAQMTQSGSEAAVAALDALGMPYEPGGVFVKEVLKGSPAAGKLLAGDIITAVNSNPVKVLKDLTREMEGRRAGEPVRLEVLRGGKTMPLSVKTTKPTSQKSSALGAKLAQYNKPPIEVSISSRDIGGPSAGLIYALSIYDRLVPEDLTGGRIIAGTGTIENDGHSAAVGAVGSVELKVKGANRIGAGVFLVPDKEAEDARRFARAGMRVIGVSTFEEAIAELKKLPPAEAGKKKD